VPLSKTDFFQDHPSEDLRSERNTLTVGMSHAILSLVFEAPHSRFEDRLPAPPMTLRPDFKFVLFFWLMLMVDAGWTQGPAFFGGGQSARYEEAAGYFHYLWPCMVSTDGNQVRGRGTGVDATPALCWPIRASRISTVDGRAERSPVVEGILMVSAAQVRFTPGNPKDVEYKSESPIANVLFRHDGGKAFATLSMAGTVYQFAFDNFCVECVQGTPPLDPAKGAQLDAEYSEVADSLKQFEVVHKRIVAMAANVLLRVRPGDQPTTDDPPAAMGLYSKLNRGLAEACPEPAKTCLRSYEAYQTCEAGAGKNCGVAPTCSAVCAVTPQVLQGLGAGLCQSPRQDSATLIPDWTDVLKKEDAERKANSQAHAWASKGGASAGGCSVLSEYRLAESKYAVEKGMRPSTP
jgi:hypothetical protein